MLRVFTLVYGDKYFDLFRRALLPSLQTPKNAQALKDAQWTIYAHGTDYHRLSAVAADLCKSITFAPILQGESAAEILANTMRQEARLCAEAGAVMFTAHPDNVFSDGSVPVMLKLAQEPGNPCVALAHPRVLPERFEYPPREAFELVDLAMENLHPSFAASDLALDSLNTWHGGVGWRRLSYGLWAVSTSCPSIFMARMTESDLPHLAKPGAWDHEWPIHVMEQGRMRFIGSSDAAFVVELTDRNVHGPVLAQKPSGASCEATYPLPYHRAARSLQAVWRGSGAS